MKGFDRPPSRLKRRPRDYVVVLPTLLTLGNAICGMMAVFDLMGGNTLRGAWLILGAGIFDALDGTVARATRSVSPLGGELDSLCDAVSFGVAPAVLTLSLFTSVFGSESGVPEFLFRVLAGVCVFYACAALLRLARFNVEPPPSTGKRSFTGLPSPAAGGTIASAAIAYHFLNLKAQSPWADLAPGFVAALPVAAFVLGLLMVSRIGYPHLINRLLTRPRPFSALVQIGVMLILAVVLHEFSLIVFFTGYTLSGPLRWLRDRRAVAEALFPQGHEGSVS